MDSCTDCSPAVLQVVLMVLEVVVLSDQVLYHLNIASLNKPTTLTVQASPSCVKHICETQDKK